jgi:SAM-dependent methyltransferase
METKRDINDYQRFYDDSPFEAEAAAITRQHVLSQLRDLRARNLLEVGCGNAPLFTDFDEADFDNFVVVEPSPIFAERAKDINFAPAKIVIFNDFIENKISQLVDFQFDTIIVSGLLHEVEFPDFIMENIAKCCGRATKILVNVPNAHSFHRLLAYEMDLIQAVSTPSDNQIRLQQHHIFDMESLIKLCEKAGFEVIEKSTFFIKPFTHRQMAHLIDAPVFPPNLLEGLVKMSKYLPDFGAQISLVLRKS